MNFLQFALLCGSSFCRNPGLLSDEEVECPRASWHSANAIGIRSGLHWMQEQVPLLPEAGWKLMPRGTQSLREDFLVYLALSLESHYDSLRNCISQYFLEGHHSWLSCYLQEKLFLFVSQRLLNSLLEGMKFIFMPHPLRVMLGSNLWEWCLDLRTRVGMQNASVTKKGLE